MKIKIAISPNTISSRTEVTSLSELAVTEKTWNKMTNSDKQEWLQEYIDNLPEQPYWQIDSFEEG